MTAVEKVNFIGRISKKFNILLSHLLICIGTELFCPFLTFSVLPNVTAPFDVFSFKIQIRYAFLSQQYKRLAKGTKGRNIR